MCRIYMGKKGKKSGMNTGKKGEICMDMIKMIIPGEILLWRNEKFSTGRA